MNLFLEYRRRIVDAIVALARDGVVPEEIDTSRVTVEPPREAEHGDLATNAAMVLAKPAGMKPRDWPRNWRRNYAKTTAYLTLRLRGQDSSTCASTQRCGTRYSAKC